MNRWLAPPFFVLVMSAVFYLTFDGLGNFLSDLLTQGIGKATEAISLWLLAAGVNPAFHALVVDGVCAGVGSVLSFLPIVAVLFFLLAILEESGYLYRVALVMDGPMNRLGLSGHSVIPLILGFGCAVPAILATRHVPDRSSRILTIFMVPFMSCSARLPIYALFTAAFFDECKV
ncbi:MAG: nucleoside recognition domain-containing protein, partial [Bacillota bacterium]|nr:nucleoside recognition domain-containing protein [Bacillota bacterium]